MLSAKEFKWAKLKILPFLSDLQNKESKSLYVGKAKKEKKRRIRYATNFFSNDSVILYIQICKIRRNPSDVIFFFRSSFP